jgi:hypothetical protein
VIGTTGAVACLTLLFLGMRSVMAVGGSCASGGPYTISQPCPKGVGWVVPVSIWAGLFFLAVSVAGAARVRAPAIAWLAWPALFCSLGWNFLEFGLDPAGPETGPVWGWLVCGVLFWVMGAGPVVLGLAQLRNRGSERDPSPLVVRAATLGSRVRATTTPPPFRAATTPSAAAHRDADDLVDGLERLADLHRTGAIDDDEYRRAKAQLLGGR